MSMHEHLCHDSHTKTLACIHTQTVKRTYTQKHTHTKTHTCIQTQTRTSDMHIRARKHTNMYRNTVVTHLSPPLEAFIPSTNITKPSASRKKPSPLVPSPRGDVAQVVERSPPMPKVMGSNPGRCRCGSLCVTQNGATSFGRDVKPRSSLCTHAFHHTRTIKILTLTEEENL